VFLRRISSGSGDRFAARFGFLYPMPSLRAWQINIGENYEYFVYIPTYVERLI